MSHWQVAGALIGGLGLFLLAVGMMSDGLRDAAGTSLRKLLSNWTRTPLHGVFSGMFMTAVVQSSSAVTVAAIGFVNAGLLNMRQTLGVIYGANIGTTMTGWLVALVGFKLNIQAFALPLIGCGMLLRLLNTPARWQAFGSALVGFGLFFVGIDILKEAFEGLVSTFDLSQVTAEGPKQIALFLAAGVVMTVLTQSSSASIALTITAAATGVVGLNAAAAMVIGANVGTTSTAVLAALGATANAKRVALAQVLFNVGTGIVALLILPIMFWLIAMISDLAGFEASPSISLALFHSVFNVLGVLLVLPLNSRLAKFLDGRFLKREKKVHLPKYLDKAVAKNPVLAVNALVHELDAVSSRVKKVIGLSLDFADRVPEVRHELVAVRELSKAISEFISSLERSALSSEVSEQLSTLLRVDQYLVSSANNAEDAASIHQSLALHHLRDHKPMLDLYRRGLREYLFNLDPEGLQETLAMLQSRHDQLKVQILHDGAEGKLAFDTMMIVLDFLGELLRLSQQWAKAGYYLDRLRKHTQTVSRDYPNEEGSGSVAKTEDVSQTQTTAQD